MIQVNDAFALRAYPGRQEGDLEKLRIPLQMLDLTALAEAPVTTSPFRYFVATDVLAPGDLRAVRTDFPAIDAPGIFPIDNLAYGPALATLIDDIRSPALTALMARKFDIDLADKPLLVTLRGRCQARDGRIHTDTESKLVTALLYLNDRWEQSGGRLRLLRGPDDIDDMLVEVPPSGGTLVAFRRAENSYHGHERYVGPRRYVMFNWLADATAARRELARHGLSAKLKQYLAFA